MSTFAIPEPISLDRRNYADEYQALLIGDGGADGGVTAVNHGEFEAAVQQLRQQAGREDDSCAVIQRGRRGGKTFMLHAVAAQLAAQPLPQQTHIVFLSLSSGSTQYDPTSEDAFTALASRGSPPQTFGDVMLSIPRPRGPEPFPGASFPSRTRF